MDEKPPILFLHGAFSGADTWTRFVAPWFAARGHRVAAPELAGRGSDSLPRLRDYVDRARDAADALGFPIVVGHSLGGLVAQHLAAEGRAAGLVLVASPGPFGLGSTLWQLASISPDVLAALLLTQAGLGELVGPDLVRRALFSEDTPDAWIADVGMLPLPESPAVLFDALAWDLPAWPLARPTPTFAVMGDRDAFVPQADLWTIRAAYGAETEVMPGLGHGLPMDPHWKSLAWRINAWLDEHGLTVRQDRPAARLGFTPGFGMGVPPAFGLGLGGFNVCAPGAGASRGGGLTLADLYRLSPWYQLLQAATGWRESRSAQDR